MKKLFCTLLAAALLLTLAACSKAPEADPADEAPDWQAQYDLGVRYLSEGNYEEAILAFEAAIKIDPKQEAVYLKYAEAYVQQGEYASALQVLERGFRETQSKLLTREENRLKREILEENPTVAALPAAVDSTGSTNDNVDAEELYRSVILEDPDGTPVQFAMIASAEHGGIWLHRYTVSENASIRDEKLVELHTEGGRTDFYVYYDAQLGCFCAANAATYHGTQSGAWGCVVKLYTLREEAQELHDWSWNSMIDFVYSYSPDIDAMQRGRLPYYPDYFEDNYSVILTPELLGECYWLYKHDSFNVFPSDIRVQDEYMVVWNSEELERFEQEMQARAVDSGEESPETLATPDWSSQLSSVIYFGDASSCRMSREAAEAYADTLEQLPKTKDDEYGTTYLLRTMLIDPGDGYPMLLTCYIGNEYLDDARWPVLHDHHLPYQVWAFNGKTAERYPFEEETRVAGTDIQFGTFGGELGIYVRDGVSFAVGNSEGSVYYTVSEYQMKLQHHLWHDSKFIYNGDDPDSMQGQEATVQDYLDDGWVIENPGYDWANLIRCELDDTVIRGNDPEYARLTEEYTRIQESFQAYPCESDMPSVNGYIYALWSSPSAMCAALRGISTLPVGRQNVPYSNEELERMTEEFYETNYPNSGKYVVFDSQSKDGGGALDVVVRFQWSKSSGVQSPNVYVADIRIEKQTGELVDLNIYETIGTLW